MLPLSAWLACTACILPAFPCAPLTLPTTANPLPLQDWQGPVVGVNPNLLKKMAEADAGRFAAKEGASKSDKELEGAVTEQMKKILAKARELAEEKDGEASKNPMKAQVRGGGWGWGQCYGCSSAPYFIPRCFRISGRWRCALFPRLHCVSMPHLRILHWWPRSF